MILRVISLMKERKKYFIIAVIGFCMLEIYSCIISPMSIKGIINGAVNKDVNTIVKSIIMFACVSLAWWILAPIGQIIFDRNSYKTMAEFKKEFTDHLLKLPMSYFDKTPTGELISYMSSDINCLESLIHRNLEQVLRKFSGGIVALIIMAILDYRFALIVLSLGSISLWSSKYLTSKIEEKSKDLLSQRVNTTCNFFELIKSAKNIRILKCQKLKQDEVICNAEKEKDFKIQSGSINAKMTSITITMDIVTYLAMLFIGCIFVYNSWADWGSVIAIIGVKDSTDMLFSELPREWANMKVSMAGVKRLFALYDLEEDEVTQKSYILDNKDNDALKLEDITFAYDSKQYVLQNFNMKVKKNTITLIEGESGKGKSTIIKLILGLYKPNKGNILFDREYNNIAYVPQEAALFKSSIYENIACGSANVENTHIVNMAIEAGVDEFVSKMPEGYETVLNDDGNSLSGGQKQRLALARALVNNADILVLDEVTSALDSASKNMILETIKNLRKNHTILFITHDKEIEKIADQIIYI